MRALAATTAALFLSLGTLGCQPRIGPFFPEAPMHAAPLERTIPLRFVVHVHCDGCKDCRASCRQGPSPQSLADSVQAANETFAAAGVRFTIGSVERVESPDWWRHNHRGVPRRWREVREAALRVFPWATADAYRNDEEKKQSDVWLTVLTAAYSRPHEITIHVQAGNGSHAATSFPEGGRGMCTSDLTFGRGSSRGGASGDLFLLAHELGHFFGLRHTFAHAGVHPATGKKLRLADRWDLVYLPGSGPGDPHRFFHSRAEADPYSDRDLRLIELRDDGGSNCNQASDGSLECTLPGRGDYSETHRSGSDALKGLSFPLRPGESMGLRWGRNATDYGPMTVPRRLSASQIEIIRYALVYPQNIDAPGAKVWRPLPDGIDTLPSYRTTVGLDPPF